MHKVIANELEIRGSHGMQAWRYEQMLAMIEAGELAPEKLIGHTIDLDPLVHLALVEAHVDLRLCSIEAGRRLRFRALPVLCEQLSWAHL